MGRIWKRLGEGKHDQNASEENIFSFEIGFYYVALVVLELTIVDQADLDLIEIQLSLPHKY